MIETEEFMTGHNKLLVIEWDEKNNIRINLGQQKVSSEDIIFILEIISDKLKRDLDEENGC